MSINFEPEIIVIPASETRRGVDGVACRVGSQVSKGHRSDRPRQGAEAALDPRIKKLLENNGQGRFTINRKPTRILPA